MTCPACNETGCSECSGGYLYLTECPLETVDLDTMEVIRLANFYQRGLPPVAGGVLDQSTSFVRAAELVFHETRYWKQKSGINDFLWASMM